jgi:uncharacterized protein HemX
MKKLFKVLIGIVAVWMFLTFAAAVYIVVTETPEQRAAQAAERAAIDAAMAKAQEMAKEAEAAEAKKAAQKAETARLVEATL